MESKSDSRQATKRARTRDQLLVSAQVLLTEHSAAGLGLRQITSHAGLAHATFYNYYPDISALLADIAELLGATHVAAMAGLFTQADDPAVRFSRITRQTLRILAHQKTFGRLLFDVGLSADRLSSELRLGLNLDIAEGTACAVFRVENLELATSAIAGAIGRIGLDLYRGALPPDWIDAATALLLSQLGLTPADAEHLACEPITFPPLPEMPMRWLALPAAHVNGDRP
jgi:hypothetical protein